jgi:transposase
LRLKEVPKDVKRQKRYQIIALSSNGIKKQEIAEFTQCTVEMVYRWSRRCYIDDKAHSGRPLLYNQEMQLKIIAFYCQTTPLTGFGRWSLRWAEKHLLKNQEKVEKPICHSTIGRILKRHHLKPHLSKYFLQITDPDFFPKMEHIISLYFNQTKYLFSFDECPGIRVLQRLAPYLRTEETMKRLEEFEYIRNGTIG